MSIKKRILTGDTPTGKLHLGHFVGTLENRVKLQHEYDTYIINADMHAFAYPKHVGAPDTVLESVVDVAIGNLAVGLDPEVATMFVESGIPEMYELGTIFSMLVTHARALRNPTIKDEIKMKGMGENYSLGFILFPILQVADILGPKAHLVPVGVDQVPHIEQAREVATKFNSEYGDIFPVPEALVGRVAKLVGTDGNPKMGKSLGNTIFLHESREDLRTKVKGMYTDPNRIHANDPGTVEGNPVFIYHDLFNPNTEEVADLKERYLKGTVGDVEVKDKLFTALDTFLAPIREKYNYYDANRDQVKEILHEGTKKTRVEIQKTLAEVKEKMAFL